MLKEHKNRWLTIIQESSLNPTDFEYVEEGSVFTIQLRNSSLKFQITQLAESFDKFRIGHTAYSPGFPYIKNSWGYDRVPSSNLTGETRTARVPKTGNPAAVEVALKEWLDTIVKRYLAELQTPDLWAQLNNSFLLSGSSTISKDDLQHFTAEEKHIIKAGLSEYKGLIAEKVNLTEEQLRQINERLDYLTEAVDRLNRFDWKGLAASTLASIMVNLAVDVETGRQLMHLFAQSIGLITGHLLPPGS